MNNDQHTPNATSLAKQINDLKDTLTSDDISVLMLTLVTCVNYKPPVSNCKGVTDKNCGYLSNCNGPCNKCEKIHDGNAFKSELKNKRGELRCFTPVDEPPYTTTHTESTAQGSAIAVTSSQGLVKSPEEIATPVTLDYSFYELVCRIVEISLNKTDAYKLDSSTSRFDQSVEVLSLSDFSNVVLDLERIFDINISNIGTTIDGFSATPPDIIREKSTTMHKFIEVVCKKLNMPIPEKAAIQPLFKKGPFISAGRFVSLNIFPPVEIKVRGNNGYECTDLTGYLKNADYSADLIFIPNSKELLQNNPSRAAIMHGLRIYISGLLFINTITGKKSEMWISDKACNLTLFEECTHEHDYVLIGRRKFDILDKLEASIDFDLAIEMDTATLKVKLITTTRPCISVLGFKLGCYTECTI